ncbi:MAG: DNA starvation/stationary phase protection protein [Myxococcota bacterium]
MADSKLVVNTVNSLLADMHLLYVKTRNYHWHVKGPHFYALHALFEQQYTSLEQAIDLLAERVVALGGYVPATLGEILQLASLKESHTDNQLPAQAMIEQLLRDHQSVVATLRSAVAQLDQHGDVATSGMLTDRIVEHEKAIWVLRSSL